jgi:hypothetical protein
VQLGVSEIVEKFDGVYTCSRFNIGDSSDIFCSSCSYFRFKTFFILRALHILSSTLNCEVDTV